MAATASEPTGDFTRRDFMKACAAASAVSVVGLVRRATAEAPKKGGTLRVGFYIEAATMDPHLSGSKVDRQIYHGSSATRRRSCSSSAEVSNSTTARTSTRRPRGSISTV